MDCCSGIRGDFDYSGSTDILDVLAIAAWLYLGGEATICEAEGNVDGMYTSGYPITHIDIDYLVEYLFRGGSPPPDCP